MRKAKSCLRCREVKRKCTRIESSSTCTQCEQRRLRCSCSTRDRSSSRLLLPTDGTPGVNPGQFSIYDQSNDVFTDLVDIYLRKLHDRPHSLFHEPTLREQTRRGLLNKALLFAICGMSCLFSDSPKIRTLENQYATEPKRLLLG